MTTATTSRALAAALGVSAPRVCQLRKFDWFPPGPPWDVDAVREIIDRNRQRAPRGHAKPRARAPRKASKSKAGKAPTTHAARKPKIDYPEPLLATLEDPNSDAVAIGTAAVQLSALRFASGLRSGDGGFRDLTELKQSLEELRRARADYLKLGISQGELVTRTTAKALAGQLVQQLLQILANVEALLPVQVEIWMATPAFRDLKPEKRRVTVTHWFRGHAHELRESGADDLEKMLAEAG